MPAIYVTTTWSDRDSVVQSKPVRVNLDQVRNISRRSNGTALISWARPGVDALITRETYEQVCSFADYASRPQTPVLVTVYDRGNVEHVVAASHIVEVTRLTQCVQLDMVNGRSIMATASSNVQLSSAGLTADHISDLHQDVLDQWVGRS